jgi:serine/threonine protein kinase
VRETENGDWKVILLDTGLLPALFPVEVSQGRPWGRAPYLSPEQAAGKQATTMSDVYILGSLLYEMVSGRPPFRSTDESVLAFQHMRQQHPSLQVLAPNAPQVLVQIVNQALAKEPPARYRNAGQLGHVLRTQFRRPQAVPPQDQLPAERSPIRERLMVPAPKTTPATGWSASQAYDPEGTDAWSDEQIGVDWLMVGLLIAAMVAVLGLIPLWRAVYRRYAAPLPSTASSSGSSLEAAIDWTTQGIEEWAGMQYLLDQSIAASCIGPPLSSSQSRSLAIGHATAKWQVIDDGMPTLISNASAVTPGSECLGHGLTVGLSMFRFGVQLTGFDQEV